MKLFKLSIVYLVLLTGPFLAFAADASTSATAGARPGGGDAAATATYAGERGFARTDTRTGNVNLARGISVGVDEGGLAFSISNAVAPRNGPAIATTLNIGIDRDGEVSTSTGVAVARGPIERSVTAGGEIGNGRPATAIATGRSDPFGRVTASTHAEQSRPHVAPVEYGRPRVQAIEPVRPRVVVREPARPAVVAIERKVAHRR